MASLRQLRSPRSLRITADILRLRIAPPKFGKRGEGGVPFFCQEKNRKF